MSLTDLEHQIETAVRVSSKLEDNAKTTSGVELQGGYPSRVRSSIRKEFSAFRKVLENSKSRLKELEEMRQTLEQIEENLATPPNKTKSPRKKVAKSPHWLPSLGRRKKFFRNDEEEARDDKTDSKVEQGQEDTTSSQRDDGNQSDETLRKGDDGIQALSPRTRDWNLAIESIQDEFSVAKSESDPSATEEVTIDEDPGKGLNLSLEARERSFRSNLQARALVMTRNQGSQRATKLKSSGVDVSEESDISDNVETEEPDDILNEAMSSSGESLEAFATRLENSIRMMTTTGLLASVESKVKDVEESSVEAKIEYAFEEPVVEPKKDKPAPFFRRVSSLSLKRLKFPKKKKSIGSKFEPPVTKVETKQSAVTASDNQGDTSHSPAPLNALKETEEIKSKVEPQSPMSRKHSFHTDGWNFKGTMSEDKPGEPLTEEFIAANELEARETYIKAMHAHQMLLKSGAGEKSFRALHSQKHLQACFQKIEYWEMIKDEYNSNPTSFSPRAGAERPASPFAEDHGTDPVVRQIPSFDPHDSCYVGEQELKAREAYIKAMRHHQGLVSARVKYKSAEWIESQQNQQKCLAELQYWESKNSENEAHTFDGIGGRVERASSGKPFYKVSLENKDDQKGRESIIESLAKQVHAKYFQTEKNSPEKTSAKEVACAGNSKTKDDGKEGSTAELPKDVLSSNESDLSQVDGNGIANAFETLCTVVLTFCIDASCRGRQESVSDPFTMDDEISPYVASRKKPKPMVKKGNIDRRSNALKSSKVKANGEAAQPGCCGSTTTNEKLSMPETANIQNETMHAIESEAKQILGHLSVDASRSDDADEVLPATPSPRVVPLNPSSQHDEPLTPSSKEDGRTSDQGAIKDPDDRISQIIDENGGKLFC